MAWSYINKTVEAAARQGHETYRLGSSCTSNTEHTCQIGQEQRGFNGNAQQDLQLA